jgi:hypothetical protein
MSAPNLKYFIYTNDTTGIDYDKQIITLQIKTEDLNTDINDLYKKNNWHHDISNVNNIYIYAHDDDLASNTIVGCVRINKATKELCDDYLLETYRNNGVHKGIYKELCKRRIKFVLDNLDDLYVLYTEFVKVKETNENLGMTLHPKDRIKQDPYSTLLAVNNITEYFRLEINRPVKDLFCKLIFSSTHGTCGGLQINDNNIYSAAHCVKNAQDKDDVNPSSIRYDKSILGEVDVESTLYTKEYVNATQYDSAIVITKKKLSINASNIYLLTNPQDLPVDFELLCFGPSTCIPPNGKIFKIVKLDTNDYFNIGTFSRDMLDSLIDVNDILTNNKYDHTIAITVINSKLHDVTVFTSTVSLVGGDSGGSFGYYFGKKTHDYPEGKNFALVGNVSIATASKYFSNAYCSVIAPFMKNKFIKYISGKTVHISHVSEVAELIESMATAIPTGATINTPILESIATATLTPVPLQQPVATTAPSQAPVETSEIAELMEANATPPVVVPVVAQPPVVATSGISELLEANATPPVPVVLQAPPVATTTPPVPVVLQAPPVATTTPPVPVVLQAPVVATSEISELLEANTTSPPNIKIDSYNKVEIMPGEGDSLLGSIWYASLSDSERQQYENNNRKLFTDFIKKKDVSVRSKITVRKSKLIDWYKNIIESKNIKSKNIKSKNNIKVESIKAQLLIIANELNKNIIIYSKTGVPITYYIPDTSPVGTINIIQLDGNKHYQALILKENITVANEILEANATPPVVPVPQPQVPVVATSEISELIEANATPPVVPVVPLLQAQPVVATSGISELIVANVAPQQQVQTTTTLNKANNKAGPYTPIDLDVLIATIPPTLVVPATPPPSIPYANYINSIEFCYRFLYFVRNNKNNQTEQLNTIAKIIMEYYAPNDTTYFNFELKKIDLTKVLIDDIIIITNKGKQKLSDVLKEAQVDTGQPTIGGRKCRTIKRRKTKSKGVTIKVH